MAEPFDTFASTVGKGLHPSFQFPPIPQPGVLNIAAATCGATLAGINYVAGFLPPDPQNLPSPPSASLFISPFTAALALPGAIPAFSSGGVALPALPSPARLGWNGIYDAKFLWACVSLPFEATKQIVAGFPSPSIPSISSLASLFISSLQSVGFQVAKMGKHITKFATALATAVVNLITSLLPL